MTTGSNSHDPYSCDGEGREADGQDDPGSHWCGSERAASTAWGEMEAEGRSGGGAGVGGRGEAGGGWTGGVGSLTHRETHGRGT